MQMKHRTAVLLVSQLMCVVLLGLWSFSATAAASSCSDNAQAYWKMFRINALQGKSAKVANATRFPFAINGTLDEGEKRLIDREEFIRILPALLKTDPGLSPASTTMKSMLMSTMRLSQSFCNSYGNQLHVGAWVFELTTEGWRFVQAFVDDQQEIEGGRHAIP